MNEKTYPLAYYMPGAPLEPEVNPRYAHTKKEEEKFIAAGMTDVLANIGPQEYPKCLYDGAGNVLLVQTKAEEIQRTAEGYLTRKPVIKERTVATVQESQGRVELLENEVSALRERMDTQDSKLDQILAALSPTKPSVPRRTRETAAAEPEI